LSSNHFRFEPATIHRGFQDSRRIRIGIDTGGTFTDVVAVDENLGLTISTKVPSTPSNPARGFILGIRKVLEMLGTTGESLVGISHGTTVATNHLLQGNITDLGFVTTEGYESILEIARQTVPDGYGNSYFWVKPDRIVPARLVKAVGGRLDHTGNELRPFDEAGAVAVARWFRLRGVTNLGVCFLHSYANPDHERRMRDVLGREHPDAVVSISSEVLREYREYERSMTTLVDAAVKPVVSGYINSLSGELAAFGDQGDEVPFYVMKSNGGVVAASEVVHQPVTTVLSGPAAGALGAALIARTAGFDKVITCDGGGTSTDVSVILDGEPSLTTEGRIGAFPSKIPMIDLVTVGAGGGSIAWISPGGTLKVGPKSAGADPGPVCYGRGGHEVTVTDAHVVLGRIPSQLLGGELELDAGRARSALSVLAGRLGLSVEACAAGILEVSAWNQANAVRQVTVKRGLDVRDFTLATFGGSGPLLACRLIDILGVRQALVPPNPGNVSAFGLLAVDARNDYVRTAIAQQDDMHPTRAETMFAELEADAARALRKQGFSQTAQKFVRTADLRYAGQASEVTVPVPGTPLDATTLAQVCDRFHDEYLACYGYDLRHSPDQHVEWVNLRVSGFGSIRRPPIAQATACAAGSPAAAPAGTRQVYFGAASGYPSTPLYRRSELGSGAWIQGPAIVEEYGSTIPIHPGYEAQVDQHGNLIIAPVARAPDAPGSQPAMSLRLGGH